MDQVTTSPAPDQALISQDANVKAIVENLDVATSAATGSYFVPMARAVGMIRTGSFAPEAHNLRPSQKARLMKAIGDAYGALYPVMGDDYERRELHISLNALGHLILVWAGDLPSVGPALDAHDFSLAFELNLCALVALSKVVERNNALTAGRARIFADMLSPSPEHDAQTEH